MAFLEDSTDTIIGAVTTVRDKINSTLESITKKGKAQAKSKSRSKELDKYIKRGRKAVDDFRYEVRNRIDEVNKKVSDFLGIVTKDDIKSLDKRMAGIESKIRSKVA